MTETRKPTTCIWCGCAIQDDPAPAPCWVTCDGDSGCDNSPESNAEGVGPHASSDDPLYRTAPDMLAVLVRMVEAGVTHGILHGDAVAVIAKAGDK